MEGEMLKKTAKPEKLPSRKVNVQIAPGNRRRLLAYLRSFNENPDRSHPTVTLTDVLNTALDDFFTAEAAGPRGEAQGDAAKGEVKE